MIPTSLYTELTPNPNHLKFVADRLLTDASFEFDDPDQVVEYPLLAKLYNFPFIDGMFVHKNFLTLKKNDLVEWTDVSLELREYVLEYLQNNQWVIAPQENKEQKTKAELYSKEITNKNKKSSKAKPVEQLTDFELKIVDILDEYVKPAVQQDGGDIVFHDFDENDGVLTVEMKGACNGCPSSTQTLKQGIQGLFQKMLPEVKEVVAAD